MSKQKSNKPQSTGEIETRKGKKKMPKWSSHFLAILAFVAVSCVYFFPQLEGKKVMQGDILQWEGMAQEALKYQKETGELTLWTNSMFGGMPTYQINNFQPSNLLRFVQKASELFFADPIGLFVSASLWMYLLLILVRVPIGVAWLGAFSFAFTSYHVIIYEAGHFLKLQSLGTMPLILAGLFMILRRNLLQGFALFSLGLGLAIYANHVQMTYYLALVLGLYFIGETIKLISEGQVRNWVFGSLLLVAGAVLALSSGASKLYTSYEYSRDTMRGQPILQPGNDPGSSSETEGLAWDYAMQWSQGSTELLTILVPGIVGGSSSEKLSRNSSIRTELKSRGVSLPADFKAPMYWGKLPFTSGPVYFGVLILFFFIYGMIMEKGSMKWWILAGVLFTLMYSLGSNLGINRFIFDHLPLMNKFRSPNSVTAVTPLLMIFLGAFSLKHLFGGKYEKAKAVKMLYYVAGILSGLSLLLALFGSSLFSFSSEGDIRLEQAGFPMQAVIADRQALLQSDAFRSLIFIVLSAGLLWLYLTEKLTIYLCTSGLILLAVLDLWGINKRYLGHEDFKSKREYEAYFTPRPVDEVILKDVDPHYRVMDLSVNTFNSSFSSYFHKSIGGYHAAKLQRYQDLIDRHISKNNMNVLNILNTKYFIMPAEEQGRGETMQINMEALGNAWFIEQIEMVNTPDEEIAMLGVSDFDPGRVVAVHSQYKDYLSSTAVFDALGTIKLKEYRPNRLTYTAQTDADQFAVFSEIWYGPNKGWQAYIDGSPVEHIRVNYALRGMKIPAGNHEIEFRFEPRSHVIGERISLVGSLMVLLAVAAAIGMVLRVRL